MSAFTLELLADPELHRIAEQAHAEVFAKAIAENRRYTRDEVADRIAELNDWRFRALRAESALRERSSTDATSAEGARSKTAALVAAPPVDQPTTPDREER